MTIDFNLAVSDYDLKQSNVIMHSNVINIYQIYYVA